MQQEKSRQFFILILGANALCENNGNAAVCKCPPDNVGDPYVSCTFDPCAQGKVIHPKYYKCLKENTFGQIKTGWFLAD